MLLALALYKASFCKPPATVNRPSARISPPFLLEFGAKPLSAEGLWLRHKGSRRRQPQPSTARRRRAGEHPSCARRPAARTQGPCISSAASSGPDTRRPAAGYLQGRGYHKLFASVAQGAETCPCLSRSAQAKFHLLIYPVPPSSACQASKPSPVTLLFIFNPPQGENLLVLMLRLPLRSIPAAKGQTNPLHRLGTSSQPQHGWLVENQPDSVCLTPASSSLHSNLNFGASPVTCQWAWGKI